MLNSSNSVFTAGVTAHSASLSSSSSTSVSLEFTSYKQLASLAGEHGEFYNLMSDVILTNRAKVGALLL